MLCCRLILTDYKYMPRMKDIIIFDNMSHFFCIIILMILIPNWLAVDLYCNYDNSHYKPCVLILSALKYM